MSAMHEVPPQDRSFQPQHISDKNARYGLTLFCIYLAIYAAFVGINAFRPTIMDWVPAAGVNLAIWYGFGLILAALALALIYAWLCRSSAEDRS